MSAGRLVPREHAWIVLGSLAAVVLLERRHARLRPVDFPARAGRAARRARLSRPARPHERWDVGLLRSVAMLAGCGVAAPRARRARLRALEVVALVAAGVRRRRRCSSCRPSRSRSGCASRHSPGSSSTTRRTRSSSPASASATGRARTATTTAGSGLERFYSLDGSVAPRHGRAPGRAPPFRLLPRAGAARGRVGCPARRRGTTTACSSHWRRSACSGSRCLPGTALGAARVRDRRGSEPGRRPRGLVRHRGRPDAAAAARSASLSRSGARPGWAGIALGAAILTKQFALAAAPFLLASLLVRGARRDVAARRCSAARP